MNRRNIVVLYALALCAGTTTTSGAMAQQKSLKEQLVGNWTFVSSIDTNKDGTKRDRFGPNAKGLVVVERTAGPLGTRTHGGPGATKNFTRTVFYGRPRPLDNLTCTTGAGTDGRTCSIEHLARSIHSSAYN